MVLTIWMQISERKPLKGLWECGAAAAAAL